MGTPTRPVRVQRAALVADTAMGLYRAPVSPTYMSPPLLHPGSVPAAEGALPDRAASRTTTRCQCGIGGERTWNALTSISAGVTCPSCWYCLCAMPRLSSAQPASRPRCPSQMAPPQCCARMGWSDGRMVRRSDGQMVRHQDHGACVRGAHASCRTQIETGNRSALRRSTTDLVETLR